MEGTLPAVTDFYLHPRSFTSRRLVVNHLSFEHHLTSHCYSSPIPPCAPFTMLEMPSSGAISHSHTLQHRPEWKMSHLMFLAVAFRAHVAELPVVDLGDGTSSSTKVSLSRYHSSDSSISHLSGHFLCQEQSRQAFNGNNHEAENKEHRKKRGSDDKRSLHGHLPSS
jgi:hypothetical protein